MVSLHLDLAYRLGFVALAWLFGRYVLRGDFGRASFVHGFFVLLGILSTFHGIARGLAPVFSAGSMAAERALLTGLALSLGGSIVGFLLTMLGAVVMILVFPDEVFRRYGS